jgi:Family of unknown function (DUF6077)
VSARLLRRILDFASDWAVLGFASWTLIAYVGMATHARVSLLTIALLVVVPLVGFLLFALQRRTSVSGGAVERKEVRPPRRAFVASGIVGGLISAVLAAAAPGLPWPILWLPAAMGVGVAVAADRLRFAEHLWTESLESWPGDVSAAAVGVAFSAMSLFINDQNADDVFYVNRATATAQLNHIPVRDVIFTDERVSRLGGTGLPVEAYAALEGALGRLFGVHAASIAYYVSPPLMTFLATWALWRLLRSWAPARAAVCFALACVFLVWSAQFDLSAGNFFLTRLWQGKVVFVAWLVPTLYAYLTRWLGRRDALTAVLLVGSGVCSIGLTSSATFVVPLIVAAAALPLLAARVWSGLPVLVATAGIPFAIGLVATRTHPLGDRLPVGVLPTEWYYQAMFGIGVVSVIAAAALWSAPWLARAGPPRALTTGIAIVAVVLLAPYVFRALNDVSGLTGSRALRRTLWVIPFPSLVGLLAVVPALALVERWLSPVPARLRAAAGLAPALFVAVLLVAFGTPLWRGDAHWESRPTWKTNQSALRTARAILSRYDGEGPVLADQRVMKAIALLTVEPKAVNPRTWYARLTKEPPERTSDRLALTRLIMEPEDRPTASEARSALAALAVGLVCVPEQNTSLVGEVEQAGYREAFRVRRQVCLARTPGIPAS